MSEALKRLQEAIDNFPIETQGLAGLRKLIITKGRITGDLFTDETLAKEVEKVRKEQLIRKRLEEEEQKRKESE